MPTDNTFDPLTVYSTVDLAWFALFQTRTPADIAAELEGLDYRIYPRVDDEIAEAAYTVANSTGTAYSEIRGALEVYRAAIRGRIFDAMAAMPRKIERGDEPRKGTAAHARWIAEGLGLSGEALELFVKGGAQARHRERVAQAEAALRSAGTTMNEHGAGSVVGIMLGLLDQVGVGGGAGGLRGRGTTRIPGLGDLGKGRKAATDGGAYDSAIREATTKLVKDLGERVEVRVYPSPLDNYDLRIAYRDLDVLAVRRYSEDENAPPTTVYPDRDTPIGLGEYDTTLDVKLSEGYRPWLRQLAERALLALGEIAQTGGRIEQADERAGRASFSFRRDDAGAWAYLLEASLPILPEGEHVSPGRYLGPEGPVTVTSHGDRW